MDNDLERLQQTALEEIQQARSKLALENLRVKFLGKAGEISRLSENMRNLPKEDRPRIGKLLNEIRNAVTGALDSRLDAIEAEGTAQVLSDLDETLPGTQFRVGGLHPLTLLQDQAIRILRRLGFALADGPDVETEWHCFDALNTPANHPARNDSDTFYLPDGRLLRSHTSTVQIRTMCAQKPPVRVIGPGAAYRRDEIDATHLNQFNQLEGLYVDRDVSVADLKGTLEYFVRELLSSEVETRLRPHYFPFTEPSFELDIRLPGIQDGKWMELLGCGMVHPAVFEQINANRGDSAYDPEDWTGFAFGIGLERLAMSLFGLPDIRLLIENDQRFLAQFAR
ncbi:MAG: phenylalanine--tRNA ligase subunit alpha [Verrucomicrobia bacterium]|nr:phenylalanine--tRNA ligase subunit alpha [Verrucomicrobiota bacterium]MBV8376642.1 phenylalanine--tRNA ligase subunit alpha [Verrucomicrobiota bacterium]